MPGEVRFESRTAGGQLIHAWTYTGSDVPVPGGEDPRMNLWLFQGRAPQNGQAAEVIVERFEYFAP